MKGLRLLERSFYGFVLEMLTSVGMDYRAYRLYLWLSHSGTSTNRRIAAYNFALRQNVFRKCEFCDSLLYEDEQHKHGLVISMITNDNQPDPFKPTAA
jgi:hypothetical protein